MRNFKKLAAVAIAAGLFATAGVAYAAAGKTPAEITSELTGKTVEELSSERAAGKTYGTIASEAGKLEEFKAQMLERKKAILDQRVKDGKLTQEQADEIYNAMKNNQAACDGTGSAGMGKRSGAGFGQGNGMGQGQGKGMGQGKGQGGRGGAGSCNAGGMGAGGGLNR